MKRVWLSLIRGRTPLWKDPWLLGYLAVQGLTYALPWHVGVWVRAGFIAGWLLLCAARMVRVSREYKVTAKSVGLPKDKPFTVGGVVSSGVTAVNGYSISVAANTAPLPPRSASGTFTVASVVANYRNAAISFNEAISKLNAALTLQQSSMQTLSYSIKRIARAVGPPQCDLIGGKNGPVLGYRFWLLDGDGYLQGCVHHERWHPAEMVARCTKYTFNGWTVMKDGEPMKDHRAPERGCGCGLYAWADPAGALEMVTRSGPTSMDVDNIGPVTVVSGFVAMYGKTFRHRAGVRAERGKVLALVEPSSQLTGDGERRRALRLCSSRYGVPVLTSTGQVQALIDEWK